MGNLIRRPNAKPSGEPPSVERHAKLDGLTAAVVTSRDESGDFLMRELQRLRIVAHYILPSAEPLPAEADIVLCDYEPNLSRRIPWLTCDGRAALIVILPQTEAVMADSLAAASPQAVLARPFTTNAILASVTVARTQFRYEQRLRGKVDRLEENLRSMRTVERAKTMLMSSKGLSDEEAYKYIRSQAMARRTSVSALAAAIVASFELLGGDTG